MKSSKAIIVSGVITMIFGIIFQFQGRGAIGPESSFMYYNKDWIDYGFGIVVLGAVLCGWGGFSYFRKR
ncbi:MAG: hypothetical protein EB166_03890 [Thaumarchaeota archaeon]|nr:hypothetical protein [Nitrososphaerota archaeon]NDF46832.1 hypothetical protein [Nitrosopumilaceae archaeon]